jgi:hypothetical protein
MHEIRHAVAEFKRTAMYTSHRELADALAAILDRLEGLAAAQQTVDPVGEPGAGTSTGGGVRSTASAILTQPSAQAG